MKNEKLLSCPHNPCTGSGKAARFFRFLFFRKTFFKKDVRPSCTACRALLLPPSQYGSTPLDLALYLFGAIPGSTLLYLIKKEDLVGGTILRWESAVSYFLLFAAVLFVFYRVATAWVLAAYPWRVDTDASGDPHGRADTAIRCLFLLLGGLTALNAVFGRPLASMNVVAALFLLFASVAVRNGKRAYPVVGAATFVYAAVVLWLCIAIDSEVFHNAELLVSCAVMTLQFVFLSRLLHSF